MILLFNIGDWFLQISVLIAFLLILARPLLIKLFERFGFLRFVGLILLSSLLWMRSFIDPCIGEAGGQDAPLHMWLTQILSPGAPVTAALGFILLMAQAFYLNALLNRINIIPKNNMIPAALYILLMSQSVGALTLNPVLCGATFVIPAIDFMFRSGDGIYSNLKVFYSALLMGIAALFCFEFIFFFPLLIVSLRVFRNKASIQSGFYAIAGFAFVFILLFLYYLIAEDIGEQLSVYANRFLYPPLFWQELQFSQYLLLGWQAFLYYMTISTVIANNDKLNDYSRKIMFFSISFVLLSLVSIFYMMDELALAMMLPAIPSTIFMGSYIMLSTEKKNMFLVEIFLLGPWLVVGLFNLYWAVC